MANKINTQKPLTPEEKENFLGINMFHLDYLFDGDFNRRNPQTRENWSVGEVEDWLRFVSPMQNFVKAMEAV
ncbi:MAG: hypothetical protein LBR56_07815 [Sporomusaceae bacterium]|jgi:hypothetical protein|nr:hypothetical protein [Sporomusaceae bacterium]